MRIAVVVVVAVVALVSVVSCDNRKELADSACKRLASCGERMSQGCCVDCAPTPKVSLTYACARRIVVAASCDKALEVYADPACQERSR